MLFVFFLLSQETAQFMKLAYTLALVLTYKDYLTPFSICLWCAQHEKPSRFGLLEWALFNASHFSWIWGIACSVAAYWCDVMYIKNFCLQGFCYGSFHKPTNPCTFSSSVEEELFFVSGALMNHYTCVSFRWSHQLCFLQNLLSNATYKEPKKLHICQ